MKENLRLSFQSVWAHKLRSFLTMLGIIIGIAAIITIVSTIKGTNEQIKQNLIGAGNNAVVLQVYQSDYPMSFEYMEAPEGISPVSERLRNHLANLNGAVDASAFYSREYTDSAFYQNARFSGSLYGIDSHYFDIYGYGTVYGRDFTQDDWDNARKHVILDRRAANTLFNGENPLGKTIEINREPFAVIGVVEMSSKFQPTISTLNDYYMYADSGEGCLFIPDSDWQLLYKYGEPKSVAIAAATTDDMATVSQKAGDILTANLVSEQLRQEQQISYRGRNLMEDAQQLQQIATATSRQLVWIAAISLLVGGIGVMNIMMVSVTERTREIGLKKALGAKRKRILGQFLTEAAVLTTIGGILGVVFGIVLAKLISRFMDMPTAVSIPAAVAATVFSVVIGLIFGLLPAMKASKLNPIDALRRE